MPVLSGNAEPKSACVGVFGRPLTFLIFACDGNSLGRLKRNILVALITQCSTNFRLQVYLYDGSEAT